jgi:hypothetical protein
MPNIVKLHRWANAIYIVLCRTYYLAFAAPVFFYTFYTKLPPPRVSQELKHQRTKFQWLLHVFGVEKLNGASRKDRCQNRMRLYLSFYTRRTSHVCLLYPGQCW